MSKLLTAKRMSSKEPKTSFLESGGYYPLEQSPEKIECQTTWQNCVFALGSQRVIHLPQRPSVPGNHQRNTRSGIAFEAVSERSSQCYHWKHPIHLSQDHVFPSRSFQTTVSWEGDQLVCEQLGEKRNRGWRHWLEGDQLHLVRRGPVQLAEFQSQRVGGTHCECCWL